MRNLIIALSILFTINVNAQNKVEDNIWVDGICEMCKVRIENALDVNGVWVAEWNVETKNLHVVYKPKKITKEQICTLLNEVGHDTEVSKATDEQYNSVHKCCLYRDEDVKKAHGKGDQAHEH
jgi:copper chaperone CopZ